MVWCLISQAQGQMSLRLGLPYAVDVWIRVYVHLRRHMFLCVRQSCVRATG